MAFSVVSSLLLVGICSLACVQVARAECCTSRELLEFKMDRGDCQAVRAIENYPHGCEVAICADGVAQFFGCNCDGGCLTGDWSQDFVRRNSHYGIQILKATRIRL
ncbi:protein Diedel [Drosophila mauritiana]|uniref:Protein Diedel n=1 Tax=Drosophila mauritiana TaxID=7226 RepID=A0A6P8KE15_DROMA|nr:protein Diedel [Drosophila mauritiana]